MTEINRLFKMDTNATMDTEVVMDLFFGWLDFTLFILMLVLSTMIGIMVMGAPTEVYLYGTLYCWVALSIVFVGIITYYLYLPVFFDLQLTSTYEYLELRYSRSVRVMASVMCTIQLLLYVPIVVYVPALAFSQGRNKGSGVDGFPSRSSDGHSKYCCHNSWSYSHRMNPSPFERLTFWIVVIGNSSNWIGSVAFNQAMVQKFLSLPTLRKARISLILFAIGIILVTSITCYTGLLIYATYHDCDPVGAKIVSRPDQILPYYVMDIATAIPGLPGLFVAGIFSAALSVVGVTNGAMVGLFTFGMFFPRGNAKGALAGSISSMLIMGWIVFGTQKAMADGTIKQPLLSSNVEGCPFNVTIPETKTDVPQEEVFILYRIAFLYYTLLGMIIVFVVGTIVSLLTAPPEEEKNNPALFTPIVRRYLERKYHYECSVPAEKEFLNVSPNGVTTSAMNVTEETEATRLFFDWLDFTLFGLMLGLSTLIGIYFGYWGKKEDSPKEYLHGGKTMSTLPVAVSLVSSFLSGVTSLGAPTEIYIYGTLYWLICISCVLIGVANYYIYLPVFFELQLTSTYEGGIKAVVWTDFLQGIVTVAASVAVVILGVVHVGGFGEVWRRNEEGGRIRFFEMSISPFERMTFWNVVIGYTFHWGGMITVNQAMVQKFLSLPSYSNAKSALYLFVIGLVLVNFITCYIGVVMFAAYHDCDPLKTKGISRPDQLLPYYVTDIGASIPGLAGLFVAGIFSSSLSTMSSSLNALGATLFEDFVRPCLKNKISDKVASNIIKCVVVIIGAVCVVNVFVVDKLGTVLQVTIAAAGVTNGAMLGLFSFGMLYPRGNSKGAIVGSITSMLIMGWIVVGTQKADVSNDDEVFILYRFSFMIYTILGWLIMFAVGAAVSLLTEPPNLSEMNPAVFTPFVRKYVRKKRRDIHNKLITEMKLLQETLPQRHD
ncbi:hypothetical protein C0J52_02922 [Blattella germanica]|nr:hypothetical protein C0J52_02922 [Blattella germanica]